MDAKVMDTRDNTEVIPYLDWPWSPNTVKSPERYGHVRAQEAARKLNEREGRERFQVVCVGPKRGARVRVYSYGRIRHGEVIETRIRNNRVEALVSWFNRKDEEHQHWYDPRQLRAAGTGPRVLLKEVYR